MTKVSVITVCYNAASVIEETIKSVINQDYPSIEYIIIDGQSNDGTLNIIDSYKDRINKVISEPDGGIYEAMNKGVKLATGEWIIFMNAGDSFCTNNVINSVFGSKQYDGYAVVYGNSWKIKRNGKTYLKGNSNTKLLRRYPIYRHGASFTKAEVHKRYLFDLSRTELKYALDYNQILSLYHRGYHFKYVDLDILNFEEEGLSYRPYYNLYLTYKITSQYGDRIMPIIWYVYSLISLSIQKIIRK